MGLYAFRLPKDLREWVSSLPDEKKETINHAFVEFLKQIRKQSDNMKHLPQRQRKRGDPLYSIKTHCISCAQPKESPEYEWCDRCRKDPSRRKAVAPKPSKKTIAPPLESRREVALCRCGEDLVEPGKKLCASCQAA